MLELPLPFARNIMSSTGMFYQIVAGITLHLAGKTQYSAGIHSGFCNFFSKHILGVAGISSVPAGIVQTLTGNIAYPAGIDG